MIKQAFPENNIGIVFSSDDNYAPYLGVIIKSLIENSSKHNNYDVLVLETSISDRNKFLIKSLAKNHSNISIRFINVKEFLKDIKFYIWKYFTVETYYRLLIPTLLADYSKVLYLDVDMIILEDLAKLYNEDISNYLLGVTLNISTIEQFYLNAKVFGVKFRKYCSEILKMKKPEEYFQAGVLIMNLDKMREENIQQRAFDLVNTAYEFLFVDQDVLNSICSGSVKILSQKWDLHNCFNPNKTPKDICEDFYRAKKSPKIIHYAGKKKVWFNLTILYSYKWWKYALQTPFRKEILSRYLKNTFNNFVKKCKTFVKKCKTILMILGNEFIY